MGMGSAPMEVTTMLRLKVCPRFKGGVHANRDMYGHYNECLQCGYIQDTEKPTALMASLAETVGKKRAA